MKQVITCSVVLSCVLLIRGEVNAARPDAAETSAREFWSAMADGDLKEMQKYYAPKVTLKAGSELLKARWELSPKADRAEDLMIERDMLLAGYERLISAAGRERWSSLFSKLDDKQITTVVARENDKPLAGILSGDLVLTVTTGPGDDRLLYVLRKDRLWRWQVVTEATDY